MAAGERAGGPPGTDLRRSITSRQLFGYVLGDVLGSGIYVLVGLVAAAVGGAFWLAFAAGVTLAILTGLAYAELATKYPRAAGASLYVSKAFRSPVLTFLVTVCMLSAVFAASGSLANGFARYFAQVSALPPTLLVSLLFIAALSLVNYVGITESVVVTVAMTFVEVAGLVAVIAVGVVQVARGDAPFGVLVEFSAQGNPVGAVVAGVALAFFSMAGFENAANVAEETFNPSVTFPRALVGGMVTAGVLYVLVAMAAALVVPVDVLGRSDAALLEVVRAGVLPVPVGPVVVVFAVVAMVAITNTTLVSVVTQSRILYGMAREGVVPQVFARLHRTRRSPWVGLVFAGLVVAALLVVGQLLTLADPSTDVVARLATVTVVFLLLTYALVIVSALKLRGVDQREDTYRASTPLLLVGLVGDVALLGYVVAEDPGSLLWVAGLLALGLALYLAGRTGRRRRSQPPDRPVAPGSGP